MFTVFFDGKCGLCAREIAYYRKIAPAEMFIWQDIANNPAPLRPFGISQAEALRYLHLLDHQGQLQIGVNAFRAIWVELGPLWRLLAYLAGLPVIHAILIHAYNRFADYRFSRLAHCQIASKGA